MASNLVKAGHKVSAFDLSEVALKQSVRDGAHGAASIADACAGAEAVVTMLPAAIQVISVYTTVFDAAPKSALLIDCSTIDVESARKVSFHAAGRRF